MPSDATLLERTLRRDRMLVISGLVLVILVSWLYILMGAGMDMDHMAAMPDASVYDEANWTPAYVLLILVMWWVMMVAMMLPSAAPMILIFASVNRKNRQKSEPYVPTVYFTMGYVVAWGGFSLIAVCLQWALEQLTLLSPMMRTTSLYVGSGLLISAGIYQLTPLKYACLRHCRSPIQFIAQRWRSGSLGAFQMGLEHGAFCLGCCWVLMALLFYGGVMNLWWIAGLALYVLIEKISPFGERISRYAGGLLILWGTWLLFFSGFPS